MEVRHLPRRIGNTGWLRVLSGALMLAGLLGPLGSIAMAQTPPTLPSPSSNVSVYATGLNNPRGLKFGPDGFLYVAEGGTGGSNLTVGSCQQAPDPVGPYTGAKTGARVSKIAPDGTRTTAVDNLPSSQTGPKLGGLISGAADVTWLGGTLYTLLSGAGCSHGVADVPNGIVKANADGTWNTIADLGAFEKSHPVVHPEADDFEPDGTWYSVVEVNGTLYALEPNHGELDKITPDGTVSRVVDISASQGHVVPTAMVYHDGNFYVGNLDKFPIKPGSSNIYKITPDGHISVFARGLTTVLGVGFGGDGMLYALEMSAVGDSSGNPTPGAGMVVRMNNSGRWETVASSLTLPTAMTFGPDGYLYVSHIGFGLPPGSGQVVKVDVNVPGTPIIVGMPSTGSSTDWLLVFLAGLTLILAGVGLRQRSTHTIG